MRIKSIIVAVAIAAIGVGVTYYLNIGSLNTQSSLVGISMPTKSLQRWTDDGNNMVKYFKEAGYKADILYAEDNVSTQVSQIDNMITKGAKVLVVAPVDGSQLGEVLAKASKKGIKIISYDRMITKTPNVDYYATFNNFEVGVLQANSLVKALKLESSSVPVNMEVFGGSSDDTNAFFFYDGAMSVLKPYIDNGRIVIKSSQLGMDKTSTANWDGMLAGKRMTELMSTFYETDQLNAVLSPNDSIALGIITSLKQVGYCTVEKVCPYITGQDADVASVKSIIKGEQYSTIFKDTRQLAKLTVDMVNSVLANKTPEVNDTKTYNNGVKVLSSYLLKPVLVDKDNYKAVLVDSSYLSADKLK